ncbi:MAG: 50S ribosomal protein L10 [Nanoarchaeota archaeon]|nr:50S ribosomal protein L10 [Nanoarchaeota archaeon]
MAHVSEKKKKVVDEFTRLIEEYPIIGAVNLENMPTKQLQAIRALIRGKAELVVSKRRLMKIAFGNSTKKDIDKLVPHLEGMPGLLFTKENPFKIFAQLEKNKSTAPAKAGQEAPIDIVVKAGATSFSPGPVIGQLGKFRIKTGIEGGKIVIKDDCVVAKKGEVIDAELAGILLRLNIEPMEIGLDLVAIYEDGSIFTKDVLRVDEDEFRAKFMEGASGSFNLAVFISYPTKDTINTLLVKAATEARSLAISEAIINKDTAEDILRKAYREMLSVSRTLPDEAKSEELKNISVAAPADSAETETKPEEKKEEENKSPEVAAAGLGSLFG